MTRAETRKMKGYIGCGMFFALLAGIFGANDANQEILFAFGFVYGALWINHY